MLQIKKKQNFKKFRDFMFPLSATNSFPCSINLAQGQWSVVEIFT